ncbi:hypothetical protein WwAna1165 [Wolbachia endosymbiont of Drosophila ananassae]|nr:hypothetical protein [Wolbachia endosymbiont (group A) of Andrena hattorfiana]EAL58844.1 hypothetical protein WwAna1165 [Wolbachia endosymbiont of Drosophila ananassae]
MQVRAAKLAKPTTPAVMGLISSNIAMGADTDATRNKKLTAA